MESPISNIPHYIPQFIWKFWLSGTARANHSLDDQRVHIYDVYNNDFSECRRIPEQTRTVFQDFDDGKLDDVCRTSLRAAEQSFVRLESQTEKILQDLLTLTQLSKWELVDGPRSLDIDIHQLSVLRRYFLFLRFRNSDAYRSTLREIQVPLGSVPVPHWISRQHILRNFQEFLSLSRATDPLYSSSAFETECWPFLQAEVCFGSASGGEEYLLPDSCFGQLEEDFGRDPDCCRFFFPVSPILTLYLLGDATDRFEDTHDVSNRLKYGKDITVKVDYGLESSSDVHLRNAAILQSNPGHLYFSSLCSISKSISSYDEFRHVPGHLDYSRLKQRCRQKYTQETVMKTLVVKGSFILTDLTDDIVKVGDSPVAHGSFSDVWKGVWVEKTKQSPKTVTVALKYLRQVIASHVREKFLKRLNDEVVAWYRLRHPHIAELYGIVQSSDTLAMVSPWCENGTICHYLKELNPSADRLNLLIQIASGISYLHNFKPIVVHGDLKGSNILINDRGQALITDFGLSKVMEELSDSMKHATSFFAGSTRWMAPDLVLALVEDDKTPPITTASDVYAFACVCLEIATGQLPYPHRTNDHAVTVDIMRGVKPSRGSSCYLNSNDRESFWNMLDRCWDSSPHRRPTISEMTTFLRSIATSCS